MENLAVLVFASLSGYSKRYGTASTSTEFETDNGISAKGFGLWLVFTKTY